MNSGKNSRLLSRNVLVLSAVSLFTDIASEMLYPVMPIYLKSIGFSIILIGILEGLAEGITGLSKGYFGTRSDAIGRRLPFVQLGYALSAVSKPMMVAFIYPIWVFLARTLDRLGKGIRTGARDALLSDEASVETKARVFGFHRAMDTFGAVLGPLLALLYLNWYPEDYRNLFLIAFAPGLIAFGFTFFIPENNQRVAQKVSKPRLADFLKYWKQSPSLYRKLVVGLLFFALFNSSDVFLLLKIKEIGGSDTWLIGAYIFYNLIYALAAYPMGVLADKVGIKKVFCGGIMTFGMAYSLMAVASTQLHFFIVFFLYGLFAAATEGLAKAWISNLAERDRTATAIGTFTAFQSIFSMMASAVAGIIWYAIGPNVVFGMSAVAALATFIYLLRIRFTQPA